MNTCSWIHQARITGSFRIQSVQNQPGINNRLFTWSHVAGNISPGSLDHSGFNQYRIRQGSITDLSPGNLVDISAQDQVPDYSARYHSPGHRLPAIPAFLEAVQVMNTCSWIHQARDHRIIQDSINTGSARDQ